MFACSNHQPFTVLGPTTKKMILASSRNVPTLPTPPQFSLKSASLLNMTTNQDTSWAWNWAESHRIIIWHTTQWWCITSIWGQRCQWLSFLGCLHWVTNLSCCLWVHIFIWTSLWLLMLCFPPLFLIGSSRGEAGAYEIAQACANTCEGECQRTCSED